MNEVPRSRGLAKIQDGGLPCGKCHMIVIGGQYNRADRLSACTFGELRSASGSSAYTVRAKLVCILTLTFRC